MGERPTRSAVRTSSPLRSLRPCWTDFLSILCGVLLFPDQWLRLLSRLWYDAHASNLEEEVHLTNEPRWRAMAEVLGNSLRWVPRTEIGMADAMNIHAIR